VSGCWSPQGGPGAETLVRGSGEAASFLTVEGLQEATNLPPLRYFAKLVNQNRSLTDLHPFLRFYMLKYPNFL